MFRDTLNARIFFIFKISKKNDRVSKRVRTPIAAIHQVAGSGLDYFVCPSAIGVADHPGPPIFQPFFFGSDLHVHRFSNPMLFFFVNLLRDLEGKPVSSSLVLLRFICYWWVEGCIESHSELPLSTLLLDSSFFRISQCFEIFPSLGKPG